MSIASRFELLKFGDFGAAEKPFADTGLDWLRGQTILHGLPLRHPLLETRMLQPFGGHLRLDVATKTLSRVESNAPGPP